MQFKNRIVIIFSLYISSAWFLVGCFSNKQPDQTTFRQDAKPNKLDEMLNSGQYEFNILELL